MIALPDWRKRGRLKSKFMDEVRKDMQIDCVRIRDAEDREIWRRMIPCAE